MQPHTVKVVYVQNVHVDVMIFLQITHLYKPNQTHPHILFQVQGLLNGIICQ